MADRLLGTPRPPTTATFDVAAWDGAPFSGTRHEAVLFDAIDLSELTVRGASFADCTFREVRFNASKLTDTAFTNCTFVHCSFFDVSFTTCKLVGSVFDRCDHKLMAVEGGDWSLVGLPGADLTEAWFSKVRMREADVSGARFDVEQAVTIAEALGLRVG